MLYKKIDGRSLDALPPGLNFFDMNVTNVAIEKAVEREFLTLNPIASAPYNFTFNTGTSYMDPRSVKLVTKMKMTKIETGKTTESNLTTDDKVGFVNGLGAIYPRNVRVMLAGQTVFDSNNFYSYKVDYDNLLNFSEDAKKSSMNTFGYYYDDKGKKDILSSKSFEERCALFVGGETVEFCAPIYADIFQQPLFLPSNLDITIEIHPQKDEFLIVAPDNVGKPKSATDPTLNPPAIATLKLKITDVRLYATFYDLHPGVALEIEKRLASGDSFRFPMRRTEMKVVFYDFQKVIVNSTIFSQFIPRNLVLAFVLKENFNGNFLTDPTHYSHMTIKEIEVLAGNMRVPSVPFKLDFKKNQIIRAFDHLHRTLGINGRSIDCGINRKMFLDGYTIFPFNLTTSLQDDNSFDFVREGPTILNLTFDDQIPTGGVMCVVMGQWDSIMYIDQTRTVRTDLTI